MSFLRFLGSAAGQVWVSAVSPGLRARPQAAHVNRKMVVEVPRDL